MSVLGNIQTTNSLYDQLSIFKYIFNTKNRQFESDNDNIYIFSHRTGEKEGAGKAYFSNGLAIEGNFVAGKPDGECTVFFDSGRIQQQTVFVNGKREGECRIIFPSGLIIKTTMSDAFSGVLQSNTVPYFRNYYKTSVLHFAKPRIQGDIVIERWPEEVEPSLQQDMIAFLHYLDLHQTSMIVDASETVIPANLAKSELVKYECFNQLQHLSIVCHDLVRRMPCHHLFSQFSNTKSLNSLTVNAMNESLFATMNEIKKYMENWNTIMNIVKHSKQLKSIRIIACPKKAFVFSEEIFSRIEEVVIQGISVG